MYSLRSGRLISRPQSRPSKLHRSALPKDDTSMHHLLSLPPEIFLLIAQALDVCSTASLLNTSEKVSRHFAPLITLIRSPINESVLTGAVMQGYYRLVIILLENGADPNCQDTKRQMSALHHAALMGDPEMVHTLIHFGAMPNIYGAAECTPLHLAAAGGHRDALQVLVQHGGNVDHQNTDGASPMYYAASRGQSREVKMLLELGAKHELKDTEGWTPLHCAAVKGFDDVVRVLMDHEGINGDAADNAQLTPLHYAAFRGHPTTVKLLLEKGVDIDAEDGTGLAAICGAANAGHEEVVSVLLERGKNLGTADALFSAAVAGKHGVIAILLRDGGESVARRFDHALRISVERGHLEVVRLLLDVDVDIDLTRPLVFAVDAGHLEIVKLLLKSRHRFHKQAKTSLKMTPRVRCDEITELLKEYLEQMRKTPPADLAAENKTRRKSRRGMM